MKLQDAKFQLDAGGSLELAYSERGADGDSGEFLETCALAETLSILRGISGCREGPGSSPTPESKSFEVSLIY
jgi:hypothetical protein